MKKYRYNNETPCHFSIGNTDFSLHKDEEYELPSDNKHIVSLVAQGFLTEILKSKKAQD